MGTTTQQPAARANRAHILWADDNADTREYVRRLLAEHYEVTAVSDGAAAVAAALAVTPDLVLTDIMMPGLDGFAVLRELRSHERTKSIPIILLSARAGGESAVEGLDAGADDYLVKPFSARDLLARVRTHVEMGKLRRGWAIELEQRVQERTAQLEQMASGMAHDINNSISPVMLYVETLLENQSELSERAVSYLTIIRRAIDDVAETVARLREF
jgi:DNA-binding response OmpR family regulator